MSSVCPPLFFPETMTPRIVLLTDDSVHGQLLLEAMHHRGIQPYAVVILTGSMAIPRRGTLLRRMRAWPGSAALAVRLRLRFHRSRRRVYLRCAPRVLRAGRINDAGTLRVLRRLEADFLLAGGGGILSPETIATARAGVLNAHPALLPWVRGSGVVGHSLTVGVPVGATLHYIDPSIDTGPLVERRLLEMPDGGVPLARLEEGAARLCAALMADAVEEILRTGEAPAAVPQPVRFPLFRWTDAGGRLAQEALAEAGRASELLNLWRPLCDEALRLRPDHFDAPPPFTPRPLG